MLGLGLDERVIEQVVLFYSGRRFVERLALEQPTLFVFEDVHWADKAQLEINPVAGDRIQDLVKEVYQTPKEVAGKAAVLLDVSAQRR